MDSLPSRSTFTKTSTESQKTKVDQDYFDAYVTIPPDGGWGWMVVVGAFFCFLLVDGMYCSFGIFLSEIARDLGTTKSEVSVIAAISTATFCFSGPFAASLVNNYGYRIVGIIGSIISITSVFATSFSKSIYVIHLIYGVLGSIGFGLICMPAVIAVGFYFEKWRGLATGIAACGTGLGGVAMPIVLTLIQEKLGWRQTFRIIAALLIKTGICTLLFKPITPTQFRRIRLNAMVSGNFFSTYHNRMYPTLSQVTEAPTITLLQPRKLNKSSEIMIMTYQSSSMRSKMREDEDIIEESSKHEQEMENFNEASMTPKNVTTIFISKKHQKTIPLHETHTFIEASMRPMYREDIFYNSSFNFLQKYKKTDQSNQKSNYEEPTPVARNYFRDEFNPYTFYDETQFKRRFRFSKFIVRDIITSLIIDALSMPDQRGLPFSPINQLFVALPFYATGNFQNIEYHMSVTRLVPSHEAKEVKCGLCTQAVKRTLATMLDYSLMKSPSFLLIALNSSFLCLGFYTAYIFIKDTAIQAGVPEHTAFWLISIIGLANTTGRILFGISANLPFIDFQCLTAGGVIIGGIATIIYAHAKNPVLHIAYAVLYGLSVACIPVLRTLIIVDTLGLEKLTNSVGLILMFQGVTSLIGISISGYLRELTGDYKWSFYFSGISLIISGMVILPLRYVNKWEQRKKSVDQDINA